MPLPLPLPNEKKTEYSNNKHKYTNIIYRCFRCFCEKPIAICYKCFKTKRGVGVRNELFWITALIDDDDVILFSFFSCCCDVRVLRCAYSIERPHGPPITQLQIAQQTAAETIYACEIINQKKKRNGKNEEKGIELTPPNPQCRCVSKETGERMKKNN